MTIRITVRLYATLRIYYPQSVDSASGRGIELSIESGTTVRQLLETVLDMPRQTVKTVFVNHVARDDDYVFKDGDQAGVFPPIAGGR